MATTTATEGPPTSTPSPGTWGDLLRLVLIVLAAVVVSKLVGRLGDVVGLILLALTVALVTVPVRNALARVVPNGIAAAITALLALIMTVAAAALVIQSLSQQGERLSLDLIAWIDSLRPGTMPSRLAGALDIRAAITDAFGRLPFTVVAGEDTTVGAASRVIDILLVVILSAFFQASAAGGTDRLASRWPRPARLEVRRFVDDVLARGGGYIRRSGLLAVVGWLAAGTLAATLDLRAALLTGAWFGVWLTLPWVGAWIGAAPLVILGALAGPVEATIAVVASVVISVAAGVARRRWIEHRHVRLGAAPIAVAFAVGVSVAGLVGVIVVVTVAALVASAMTSPYRVVRPSSSALEHPADAAEVPASVIRRLVPARPVTSATPVTSARPVTSATPATPVMPAAPVMSVLSLVPSWSGAAVVLGAVAGATIVWVWLGHLGTVAIWLAVAGLVAVALNRPVGWIGRRAHLPRPMAIGVVVCLALGLIVGATALGVSGGAASTADLDDDVPAIVTDLEGLPVVGPWLRDQGAAVWVADQMENLPQRVSDARNASDWLPTVGARMLDLLWVSVLAAALLVDGPRVTALTERHTPARWRRQTTRLARVSHAAIGGYLGGAALLAGINATVVFVLAVGVGLALAPVLAVWAFVWNFVPQIGGFMGGFPLVVLALAEGPIAAAIAGLGFLTYQLIENHLLQPAIIGEAIDVPPWVALVGALAGGAAAGVVGAVVLTPLVGVIRVAAMEIRRGDFPGNTVPLTSSSDVTDDVSGGR